MSVSMQIFPLSDTVDMFGEPDVTSAYSLSGHIAVSISSPTSLFERRRVARLILQSLTITFEGQSELITAKTGYIPFRICSITRDLAPSEPVELSNEGHEDSDQPCVWNVVFNLPIPGWLPASSVFGLDEDGGTRYTLYATAMFSNLDGHSSNSWFSYLCSPFRSSYSRADTHQRIVLNRFMKTSIPTSSSTFLLPIVNHALQDGVAGVSESSDNAAKVLSKIQVLASVPEYVDTKLASFPFAIRLRPTEMDESEYNRLQVTGFTVQLHQIETYRDTPTIDYVTRFPVPPVSSQPPDKPLINPHSLGALHDLGFLFGPIIHKLPASRSFSLLPDRESGRFSLSDSHVFAGHTNTDSEPSWYSMESSLPFVHCRNIDDSHWAGPPALKPSGKSPLFDVHHEMFVSLSCAYSLPDGEKSVTSELQFTIPVRFAHIASPVTSSLSHVAHYPTSSVSSETTPFFADMPPSERHLPAYSQLFDSSGERLIDYSTPLPLYSPPSSASSSSQTLDTITIAASEVKSEISQGALVLL